MLAPGLLNLVLPMGEAESWEVTTSAKDTETRDGKEKNLLPQPQIPANIQYQLGLAS